MLLFCSNKVTQLTSENRALKKKRRIEERDVGRRHAEGKPGNRKSFLRPSLSCFLPSFLSVQMSFIIWSFPSSLTLLPFHSFVFLSFMLPFQPSFYPFFLACWYVLAGNFLLSLSILSITFHKKIFFLFSGR